MRCLAWVSYYWFWNRGMVVADLECSYVIPEALNLGENHLTVVCWCISWATLC